MVWRLSTSKLLNLQIELLFICFFRVLPKVSGRISVEQLFCRTCLIGSFTVYHWFCSHRAYQKPLCWLYKTWWLLLCIFDDEIQENIMQSITTFSNVTLPEHFLFLEINMIMGYQQELPSWANFWSRESHLSAPFASIAVPRYRFSQILINIHVNYNAWIPNNNIDKVHKLRPMMNQLNSNFVKLHNVSHHVSLDELTIFFKGRNNLKQYLMKLVKRGFKLWSLTDKNGYLYHRVSLSRKDVSVCRWFTVQVFWPKCIHSMPT